LALAAAFIQPVMSRAGFSASIPTEWDRDRRRDEPCVSIFRPAITMTPGATSSARPYATAIAHAIRRGHFCSPSPTAECSGEDRPKRPASRGALFPSAILQRRCVCPGCQRPDWAASTLRTAGAVGRGWLIAAIESPCLCESTSVRPCGFSPDVLSRDAVDSAFWSRHAIGGIRGRSGRRIVEPFETFAAAMHCYA
jgi:hypothetical protein